MPGAGALRDRIRFDHRGTDANGDPIGAWVEGFTVWAQLLWLRGSETAIAQRLEGRQPVAIVVRTSSQARTITQAFRAVNVRTGVEFNITSVSPAKEPAFIDILAVAGGAPG